MTHQQIRKIFLDYFSSHDHVVVPSSPLVPPPQDDSVLLTTAGMQQFKPHMMGDADPISDFNSKRLASIQKCFRTSDIEEVGDEDHLTFFEMLGNFSVGDYFKETAIPLAWNLLTGEYGLDPGRMFVTVFSGGEGVPKDKEAREIWEKEVPGIEVRELGMEDNFWGPPGETGPCGPSSEIYYVLPNGKEVEIWNLVFMEYYKDEEGKYTKLKAQNIDTGMGMERLALVLQKKDNVFETDLFAPLISEIEKLAEVGKKKESVDIRSLRIIADHIRGGVFLASDGVKPLNVERGYVLRRVLRRAILHGRLLDINGYFLVEPARKVIEMYGEFYPDLEKKEREILQVIEDEEGKFLEVLSRGTEKFEEMAKGKDKIDAFTLYDTYGFPLELTQELADARGLEVDVEEFERKLEKQRQRAREAAKEKEGVEEEIAPQHTAAHLLNAALKKVLGPSVRQAGQHISSDKFRHDFIFTRSLSEEESVEIEKIVNEKIEEDLPVKKVPTTYEEAKEMGAEALFKEKYENVDELTLYHIGEEPETSFSKELCGGPHVESTGELGKFEIIKEESAGSGVRRIYGRALPTGG